MRGRPVPTLNTHPQAAEGDGWARKDAEGRPTLVLSSEDASHETLVFHRLTPTPKGPMGAEGCPTLALFFEEAAHETTNFIGFIDFQ